MITINIGVITKRINSTKSTMDSSTSVSVVLKEPCSFQTPVFKISNSDIVDGNYYNYCKWGSWCYWIDDIISLTNNIVELHCRLDPLATYKSSIMSTYALVAFGDYDHWNKQIDDSRMQPEISPFQKINRTYNSVHMFYHEPNQDPFDVDNDGCIVMTFTQTSSLDPMGVAGKTGHDWTGTGSERTDCGIHTAIMTVSAFRDCITDLHDFDWTSGLTTAGALEVIQAFQNAMQATAGGSLLDNILRVIWLPINYTSLWKACNAGHRTGLMLGGTLSPDTIWYEIPSTLVITYEPHPNSGAPIKFTDADLIGDISGVTNPQFLKNDRFLAMQITTPAGYQNVPTECFRYGGNELYYKSALCVADGSYVLKISSLSDMSDTICAFSGNIGVNMMGTIYGGVSPSMQVAEAGAGIVSGALKMAVGSWVGGAIGGIGAGAESAGAVGDFASIGNGIQQASISSGINNMLPNSNYNVQLTSGTFGGNSASLFIAHNPATFSVVTVCQPPKDIANYENYCSRYGYPCNSYLELSDLASGSYCQCAGASVNVTNASESAISTINSYLNSGIYLE